MRFSYWNQKLADWRTGSGLETWVGFRRRPQTPGTAVCFPHTPDHTGVQEFIEGTARVRRSETCAAESTPQNIAKERLTHAKTNPAPVPVTRRTAIRPPSSHPLKTKPAPPAAPARTASPPPLGPRASNQPAASPWIIAVASPIHGHGLQARVEIPDGTRILEYIGERISKRESRRREQQRLLRAAAGGDASVYIFHLNRTYDLDGDRPHNLARYINHSCAPNCRAENIRGHIWITARRDIPAGAELSFDYGFGFREWRLHPCRCGAERCVGFIVNAGQRWLVRRALRAERQAARVARSAS